MTEDVRLPIWPDDPPAPLETWQESLAQLIYAVTLGVYKLNTLIDIEIKDAQR